MATIRKRGDVYQIDYFDPSGKRVRKSFKRKKDAEAELSKRVSLIHEGRYLDVKKELKTTVGELVAKYRENYESQPAFMSWKTFCLDRFSIHFGADTLLSKIRYVDFEGYRNHLRHLPTKSGGLRTTATVNRELSCIRHMMNKAVEWEMAEENPFNRGKCLIVKENNARLRFLSEDEIKRLLAECPKHLLRVVECALNTGMRRREILTLTWEQIRNGLIYLTETKTDEPREIPINATLKRLFAEIRKEQGIKPDDHPVFTFAKGEDKLKGVDPVRGRKGPAPVADRILSLKTSFNAAVRRAGIRNFRFHDLRHTFASHMVMRGASMKELQEILGHKSMTMTMRYAHLSQEHKKKAVNLLDGLTAATCHKMSQNSAVTPFDSGQVLDITGRGERI